MQQDIVDKFTTHLKDTLTRALVLATEGGENVVHPTHLLWALALEQGSVSFDILKRADIKADHFKRYFTSRGSVKTINDSPIPLLSEEAKRALEKAVLTANIYEHKYVGTEHLLSGILQIESRALLAFFNDENIDLTKLREQVAVILRSTSRFPEFTDPIQDEGVSIMMLEDELPRDNQKGGSSKTPALDYFAQDLTSDDVQAGIDPVIAREKEIERVMEILSRRTKNNPLLLGEAGVGKTAIVEGLAKRILAGEVPAVLQGKRIMALDLALVLAGTMYRGEFEERLRQIIDEVRTSNNVVLFIDEIHTIIGAGASSGSMDAANILKPALARGEIRCIGATTPQEYKKHIETDAALERRFQTVQIQEPSTTDTIKILKGIAENYEKYHGVKITAEAIAAAVDLSERYLHHKFLPDKAIDLIDEAAAAYRIANSNPDFAKQIAVLEQDLKRVRAQKRQAVVEEHFIKAKKAKAEETALITKINAIKVSDPPANKVGKITRVEISKVIAKATGIPVANLVTEERKRLVTLEADLAKHLIGQPQAVAAVADAVKRSKTGVTDPNRPLASFLFLGPSGVGKTELARTLAKTVFQQADSLVQLDMSEFAESYTVSKLIGSPAGYVGYRETALLTDKVKQKPYSVVLFDELEKAHADVQNLLLQILENGELSESTGRKISFRNSIIVITSNIGLERFASGGLGFSGSAETEQAELKSDIQTELTDRFRPELVNRVDKICIFKPLSSQCLTQIAQTQLKQLSERLLQNKVKIVYNSKVAKYIAGLATESEVGAREIRRIITNIVEAEIAKTLLTKPKTKELTLAIQNGNLIVHTNN